MYTFSNIIKVIIIQRFTYAILILLLFFFFFFSILWGQLTLLTCIVLATSKHLKPIYLEFHFSLLNDVTLWQRKFIIYENCILRRKKLYVNVDGKACMYLSWSGYLWCKSHQLGFVEVKLQFLGQRFSSLRFSRLFHMLLIWLRRVLLQMPNTLLTMAQPQSCHNPIHHCS